MNNTVLVAIIALLIGGISGYGLNALTSSERGPRMMPYDRLGDANDEVPMGMHRMPDGTMMQNPASMGSMDGMGHMMEMSVTSEREFIEGMIPHHEEAIATAKEVLERGATTPAIRTLMENIVSAQEAEVASMKVWYEAWYGTPYQSTESYAPMMSDLRTLSGEDIDRTFLTDMIMHHMGAIMMAQSVQPYIEHEEIKQLTEAIVTSQMAEMHEMRQLLRGL